MGNVGRKGQGEGYWIGAWKLGERNRDTETRTKAGTGRGKKGEKDMVRERDKEKQSDIHLGISSRGWA
jgi:hypothetical protein